MWFSAAYALGQDGMWLTVYARLSGVINRKKNRIEEKGGIVRKAKGRRKIEMEIAKKDERKFSRYFFPVKYITHSTYRVWINIL